MAQAEAELARAQLDVERYKPLVPDNAIPKQVYDNAVAAAAGARAALDAQRALITQANLNIEYSRITAPVVGRIGRRLVDPGGLVTAGTTVLATVSQDDPAYVYFSISENSLIDLQRRLKNVDPARPDRAGAVSRVTLSLSDGSEYPEPGTINFADRAIDPSTGTFTLRATFPNKDRRLLTGQYARVRALYEDTAQRAPRARAGSHGDARAVLRRRHRRGREGGGTDRHARAARRPPLGHRKGIERRRSHRCRRPAEGTARHRAEAVVNHGSRGHG